MRAMFRYEVPVDGQPHDFKPTWQPVPDDAAYVGTAPRSRGLVWHLFALVSA